MSLIQWDPRAIPLCDFVAQHRVCRIIDEYEGFLDELLRINNPKFRFEQPDPATRQRFIDDHCDGRPLIECGSWFFFAATGVLAHFLPQALHDRLRTARNRFLITDAEQSAFRDCEVGIAGLSVGSHAATTLVMMGGAQHLRIADPDRFSGSNFNRVPLGFTWVGGSKCDVISNVIWQLNPYAQLQTFPEGVDTSNLAAFMTGLDVVIDCMDDLEMKIRIRLQARQLGIPVLMATDNGDGVILDVERHDLDPTIELFNGVAGPLTLEQFQRCPPTLVPKLATRIAGIEAVHPRMLRSVSLIGSELYSWPQLGSAATMTGAALAYAVRRLATGLPLESGRTLIDLEAALDPTYDLPTAALGRRRERIASLRALGFDDAELARNGLASVDSPVHGESL